MASNTFGQKVFQPKAPVQGAFPLDHENECKQFMLNYMLCMAREKSENTKCRVQAKEYLSCRMEHGLMDKRDLDQYGFEKDKTREQSINNEASETR